MPADSNLVTKRVVTEPTGTTLTRMSGPMPLNRLMPSADPSGNSTPWSSSSPRLRCAASAAALARSFIFMVLATSMAICPFSSGMAVTSAS